MDYFIKAENEKNKLLGLPEREIKNIPTIEEVVDLLPFSWGIDGLNIQFGLIPYSRFIVLAGEGGSGKTTFTMQQAINNAKAGNKVAYMSLEMGSSIIPFIAKKRACIQTQTEIGKKVFVTEHQKKLYNEMIEMFKNTENLKIIGYKETLDFNFFTKEIDKLASEFDLIFIDNLGMICRGEKEMEIIPKITEKLMKVRHNNKCSIIALHHLSKGKEGQEGPRGKNAVRGSGKILDDVDLLALISRGGNGDTTTFQIAKDRYEGNIGICNLLFNNGEFRKDFI